MYFPELEGPLAARPTKSPAGAPAPRPWPALGKQRVSTQGATAGCRAGERCANGTTVSVENRTKAAPIALATASAAPGFGCKVLRAPSRRNGRDKQAYVGP